MTTYQIVATIWVLGAPLIPAVIARYKRRGFWLFYLFGLLLWIVAVPVSLLVKSRREVAA